MTDDVPKPCLSRSHTDRLRCCLPQGHKGDHMNQTVVDVRQVKWIDAPEAPILPSRPTASTITDIQLDQLYAETARLESELSDYETRVEQLTAELAALRTVARGYCPHCGRGDASPTVQDWEQQKQRADQAEAALAHLQASSEAAGRLLTRTTDERDQLQAAIRRVHELVDECEAGGHSSGHPLTVTRIRAALDEPAAGTTATQATDNPKGN